MEAPVDVPWLRNFVLICRKEMLPSSNRKMQAFSLAPIKSRISLKFAMQTHYYQAMWTLVGGGIKKLQDSGKPMAEVLPKKAKWIKDRAAQFFPEENRLVTASGEEISYDFLVLAMGLQLDYNKVIDSTFYKKSLS